MTEPRATRPLVRRSFSEGGNFGRSVLRPSEEPSADRPSPWAAEAPAGAPPPAPAGTCSHVDWLHEQRDIGPGVPAETLVKAGPFHPDFAEHEDKPSVLFIAAVAAALTMMLVGFGAFLGFIARGVL